jgi:hypothetical protein
VDNVRGYGITESVFAEGVDESWEFDAFAPFNEWAGVGRRAQSGSTIVTHLDESTSRESRW